MDRSALPALSPVPPTAATVLAVPDTGERTTVVHIASGDLWAGAEVQLFNLACALDADPHIRLFVVLFNPGLLAQRLQERGVSVQVFDENRLGPPRLLARVYRFLKQVRPHIVHTHREKENVIGALAARLVGARSLRTVHGASEHPPRAWQLHRRAQRALDGLCAQRWQQRIVAVSPELGERLRTGTGTGKICVVENGIDVERVRELAAAPVTLPGEAGGVRIALIARLVPVKRIDVFLAAAALLTARHSGRFQFHVFGDGPLRAALQRDVERLGLQRRVHWMGFCDPVAPCLARMDLLFITSDHEGLPMNLLEALSLEVPVVAHAVGGIPRVLDGGRCGTLVTQQRAEAYAAAAERYLTTRAEFLHKAKEGYAHVQARYAARVNARAMKSLYAQLSGRG